MKITDVVIVADVSSSMGHLQGKQQEAIWQLVQTFAAEEKNNQLYLVSIHPFGLKVGEGCTTFKPASRVTYAELSGLVCNQGATRLLDAIGHALTQLKARRPDRLADAALVQVFTDGGENASSQWGPSFGGAGKPNLGEALKQEMAADWFTLAVTGPSEAGSLLGTLGLPSGNFRQWDGRTTESYVGTVAATTQAAETYTQARAKGVRSTTSYYVDPSKLNTAGVRSMAKKVTPSEVKTVSKRMDGRAIADFFTKFEKGQHYYQLIKPEYIDQDKDLVVHIKDKDEYRQGSRSVRILLGLPEDGRIRVKPSPASSNFDVFIQSASVNRKLVEGQKLLTL